MSLLLLLHGPTGATHDVSASDAAVALDDAMAGYKTTGIIGTTSTTLTGLTPGKKYAVSVRAVVDGLWSDWSAEATAFTVNPVTDSVTATDTAADTASKPRSTSASATASDTAAATRAQSRTATDAVTAADTAAQTRGRSGSASDTGTASDTAAGDVSSAGTTHDVTADDSVEALDDAMQGYKTTGIITTNTFTLTSLTPGKKYAVSVRTNYDGAWSDWSSEATAFTVNPVTDSVTATDEASGTTSTPVPVPTNFANTATDFTWDDMGVDDYNLYRSVDGGSFVFLQSTAGVNHTTDGSATPGHIYQYKLTSVLGGNESDFTDIITLFMPAASDTFALTDTATVTVSHARTATDSITLAETASGISLKPRTASDSVTATDAATGVKASGQFAVDSLTISDAASVLHVAPRSASDAVTATDTASASKRSITVATDAATASDQAMGTVSRTVGAGDVIVFSDGTTAHGSKSGSATDTVTASDTATATAGASVPSRWQHTIRRRRTYVF